MFIVFGLGLTSRSLTAVGIFVVPLVATDVGVLCIQTHAARSTSRVSFLAGAPLISMTPRANASALPQRPGIPSTSIHEICFGTAGSTRSRSPTGSRPNSARMNRRGAPEDQAWGLHAVGYCTGKLVSFLA